jgi:hypothetical protein
MTAQKRKSLGSAREPPKVPKLPELTEYIDQGGNINVWFAMATSVKATAGDTSAARDILEDFVFAIDARSEKMWPQIGPPIHWAYARYLADAFAKILNGTDAAVALGVKNSKPGRRSGTRVTHDLEGLAAAFNLLLLNGLKPKQAKLSLKEKTGAAVRTIEKANDAYVAYGYYLRDARRPNVSESHGDFAAEIMKSGARGYAAQIESILAARKLRRLPQSDIQ